TSFSRLRTFVVAELPEQVTVENPVQAASASSGVITAPEPVKTTRAVAENSEARHVRGCVLRALETVALRRTRLRPTLFDMVPPEDKGREARRCEKSGPPATTQK